MMEIKRKDGIVYERKRREKKLDTSFSVKISEEQFEEFKRVVKSEGKKYNAVIRELIDCYLESRTQIDTQ